MIDYQTYSYQSTCTNESVALVGGEYVATCTMTYKITAERYQAILESQQNKINAAMAYDPTATISEATANLAVLNSASAAAVDGIADASLNPV